MKLPQPKVITYIELTSGKTIDNNTAIDDYFINNGVVQDQESPFELKFGSKMYADKN